MGPWMALLAAFKWVTGSTLTIWLLGWIHRVLYRTILPSVVWTFDRLAELFTWVLEFF